MKQNSTINQEKAPIVYIDEVLSRAGCTLLSRITGMLK